MRIAVAGGTGTVGRHVVDVARERGHDVVILSRSTGVDLMTGAGLTRAIDGTAAVIDVASVATQSAKKSIEFFEITTNNLLAAEKTAGVPHHLALSIVGSDRAPFGYYAGKQRQEQLVSAGPVPWTILRATQFHEFAQQTLDRVPGPLAVVPRMRTQPVAAREVAQHLVQLVQAPAQGMAPELAGPRVEQVVEMTGRLLRARHQHRLLLPVKMPGATGTAMTGDGLLPTGPGPRGSQTFDEWLTQLVTQHSGNHAVQEG